MFIVVGLIFGHMFQNHFLFIVSLGNSVEILLVWDFNKAFYSVLFYKKNPRTSDGRLGSLSHITKVITAVKYLRFHRCIIFQMIYSTLARCSTICAYPRSVTWTFSLAIIQLPSSLGVKTAESKKKHKTQTCAKQNATWKTKHVLTLPAYTTDAFKTKWFCVRTPLLILIYTDCQPHYLIAFL